MGRPAMSASGLPGRRVASYRAGMMAMTWGGGSVLSKGSGNPTGCTTNHSMQEPGVHRSVFSVLCSCSISLFVLEPERNVNTNGERRTEKRECQPRVLPGAGETEMLE